MTPDAATAPAGDGNRSRIKLPFFTGVLLLLIAAAIMRSAIATRLDGFTIDEAYHIGAGVSYVRLGDFRINPEHPPLVKLWIGSSRVPDLCIPCGVRKSMSRVLARRARVTQTLAVSDCYGGDIGRACCAVGDLQVALRGKPRRQRSVQSPASRQNLRRALAGLSRGASGDAQVPHRPARVHLGPRGYSPGGFGWPSHSYQCVVATAKFLPIPSATQANLEDTGNNRIYAAQRVGYPQFINSSFFRYLRCRSR